MKIQQLSKIFLVTLGLLAIMPASHALIKSHALLSPYCNEKVIREIAGDAIVSINTYQLSEFTTSYSITLDTNKMYYWDLIDAMKKRACFEGTSVDMGNEFFR